MTRHLKIALGLCFVVSMSGCQGFDSQVRQKSQQIQPKNHAALYCLGVASCVFERMDNTIIVNAESGQINPAAIDQGLLRLRVKQRSKLNTQALLVPRGSHELVIRFYPISRDRAETFHLIHNFEAAEHYQFLMYRKRANTQHNLLDASAPAPLCVDVQQNRKTIRRFCKPFDAATGIAEFVEQKI
jgi:hypothetical protein